MQHRGICSPYVFYAKRTSTAYSTTCAYDKKEEKRERERALFIPQVECIADLVNNKLQPIRPLLSRVIEPAIVSDLHKFPLLQRVCVCRGGNGKFVTMGFPY